jgi:hypothetical protein
MTIRCLLRSSTWLALALAGGMPSSISAQNASAGSAEASAVRDVTRLAGVLRVQVRADVVWDEMITMSAGGATADQFGGVLQETFADAIASADDGPGVVAGAAVTVACHVDTFYEPGQIIYSLRTQLERAGSDGRAVIVWIRSWVGNFGTQQMHRMFTLGERCAESFLEDWRAAN